ncbi:hypothetical protein [Gordonia rhizosphera]|nr:hypothetical protein [Gordonia rhizosphera]
MDDLVTRLVHRADARAAGITDDELRRDVKNKVTERVWRGVYLPTGTGAPDGSSQGRTARLDRYRATVIGAARHGGPERTASHVSTAAMQRVPLLWPDLSKVHFTSATTGKSTGRAVIHQSALEPDDIVVIDDIRVTSPARTVYDVARTGDLRRAVCALDSGLHLGATPDELAAHAQLLKRHRGVAMLRAALPLANGLSESVGESLSRLVLAENELIPTPELQVEIAVVLDGRKKPSAATTGGATRTVCCASSASSTER